MVKKVFMETMTMNIKIEEVLDLMTIIIIKMILDFKSSRLLLEAI